MVVAVISVWAGLALKVKRLHDRGRSGFWLLAGLIPVLGWLWLFWELGLAPGKPKGARFDKGASRTDLPDDPPRSDGAAWMAPAALAGTAGGLAFAAEDAAHAEEPRHLAPQSEVAPESGYGVIAPAEAPVRDEHDALPEAEPELEPAPKPEPAPAAAVSDPYTPAEAAQVTQAQIADYLASVDHETPPAPAEPVHAPEPEPPAALAEAAASPPAEAIDEAGPQTTPEDPPHVAAAADHPAEAPIQAARGEEHSVH